MTKKNEFMIFFTPEIDSKHNNQTTTEISA